MLFFHNESTNGNNLQFGILLTFSKFVQKPCVWEKSNFLVMPSQIVRFSTQNISRTAWSFEYIFYMLVYYLYKNVFLDGWFGLWMQGLFWALPECPKMSQQVRGSLAFCNRPIYLRIIDSMGFLLFCQMLTTIRKRELTCFFVFFNDGGSKMICNFFCI